MQITSQGAVAMLEYLNHVVILPVCGSWRSVKVKCLLMSERLSCSCNGFEEPVNKKPEYTLPADLPIAIWSEFVDYYQIYSASREDGPFFSGQYLRVQNSTKCHFNDLFNRPGKTRRLSVKGMLAFFFSQFEFWAILVHGRLDDSSHFVHVIDTHYVWHACDHNSTRSSNLASRKQSTHGMHVLTW